MNPSRRLPPRLPALLLAILPAVMAWNSSAWCAEEPAAAEFVLGPADVVHITVFGNQDLSTDVRVSETGTITFPLIGKVPVVGLTLPQAQAAIAKKLKDGHFVADPQVTILPTQIIGSQVTVVGHVNKPGRYPLQTINTLVSDALAATGGVDAMGADTIYLIQHHDGKEVRTPLDMTELFVQGSQADQIVQGGDTLYVPRQPLFYVYGEVEKPGSYRLERHMTVMQGLAIGGYSIEKGSKSRTQIFRQDEAGTVHEIEPGLTDLLQPNDVIYVRVRLF